MSVHHAVIEPSPRNGPSVRPMDNNTMPADFGPPPIIGMPAIPIAALSRGSGAVPLRIYEAYHPDARINFVTYRGRTVWMTQKQFTIWKFVQNYKVRHRRLRMADVARFCGCSVASVSRFLRRLDLWRFIDLATLRGRTGGTWIVTRHINSSIERDANLAGARHTWQSRQRARDRLLSVIIKNAKRLKALAPRQIPVDPIYRGMQLPLVPTGSTGAKYEWEGGTV